jgi:hypothetical protein
VGAVAVAAARLGGPHPEGDEDRGVVEVQHLGRRVRSQRGEGAHRSRQPGDDEHLLRPDGEVSEHLADGALRHLGQVEGLVMPGVVGAPAALARGVDVEGMTRLAGLRVREPRDHPVELDHA